MPQYDSDDYYDEQDESDYSNSLNLNDGGLNEDDLNDDEYDQLYDVLDEIKQFIKNNNDDEVWQYISKLPNMDKLVKLIIWNQNFDFDLTLIELREQYELEAKSINKITNKVQVPSSMLGQGRGKNSKLSDLIKSKSLKMNSNEDIKSNKLSDLIKNRKINQDSSTTSKLSQLISQKKVMGNSDASTKSNNQSKLSSLITSKRTSSIIKPQIEQTSILNKNSTNSESIIPQKRAMNETQQVDNNDNNNSPPLIFTFKKTKIPPVPQLLSCVSSSNKLTDLLYSHTNSNAYKPLTKTINNTFKDILCPITNSKNNNLNNIAKKAKQKELKATQKANFNKISPDEKQSKIDKSLLESTDEISEDLSNVKISQQQITITKPRYKIDVDSEINNKSLTPTLSTVVFGNVDSGKSTLIGRLLFDLKIIDSKTMHKLTKESENLGKPSFSLAWVMDQTDEERSRGITVDICQTQFDYHNGHHILIDSPGHQDYIPQMINGLSQADIAVLIIDSNDFEKAFNIDKSNAKEQIMICKSLGVSKLIVNINKLDLFQWSQEKYQEIKEYLEDYLISSVGFTQDQLVFIPVSGYLGDNIINKSKNRDASWYTGPTLIELLEHENELSNTIESEKSSIKDDKFLLNITDIDDPSSSWVDSLTVWGRVLSGSIQPGESIIVAPSNQTGLVDAIKINKSVVGSSVAKMEDVKLAIKGELITIRLKKIENIANIKIGDIITKPNSFDINSEDLVGSYTKFKCDLKLFNNMSKPLLIGTPFVMFRNNISVPARITDIEAVFSKKTSDSNGVLKKKKKKVMHLTASSRAICEIEITERELPLLTYEESSKLGRIVLRKDGETIGAGLIVELIK